MLLKMIVPKPQRPFASHNALHEGDIAQKDPFLLVGVFTHQQKFRWVETPTDRQKAMLLKMIVPKPQRPFALHNALQEGEIAEKEPFLLVGVVIHQQKFRWVETPTDRQKRPFASRNASYEGENCGEGKTATSLCLAQRFIRRRDCGEGTISTGGCLHPPAKVSVGEDTIAVNLRF